MTVIIPSPVNTETTRMGNKNLIPKTAIKIPQVKNLCCQMCVICSSFIAFMTALSKDKLTSRMLNTQTAKSPISPLPNAMCSLQKYAVIKPIIVTKIDSLK